MGQLFSSAFGGASYQEHQHKVIVFQDEVTKLATLCHGTSGRLEYFIISPHDVSEKCEYLGSIQDLNREGFLLLCNQKTPPKSSKSHSCKDWCTCIVNELKGRGNLKTGVPRSDAGSFLYSMTMNNYQIDSVTLLREIHSFQSYF